MGQKVPLDVQSARVGKKRKHAIHCQCLRKWKKSLLTKQKVKVIPSEMCGVFFFPAEPCRAVQVEPLLGAAEQTGTALLRVSALTTTHKPRAVLFIFLSFHGAKR